MTPDNGLMSGIKAALLSIYRFAPFAASAEQVHLLSTLHMVNQQAEAIIAGLSPATSVVQSVIECTDSAGNFDNVSISSVASLDK